MPFLEQRFVRPSSTTLTRLVNVLFAIISLICFSTALSAYHAHISPNDASQRWNVGRNYSDIIAIVAISNSLLWLLSTLYRSLFTNSPLHPGWCVSMDLFCFLALLGTLIFGELSSGVTNGSGVAGGTGPLRGNLCVAQRPADKEAERYTQCVDAVNTVRQLDTAGYAFGWIVCVLFFASFVKSCIDCYRYHRSRGIREIKYEIRLDDGSRPNNSREHFVTVPNSRGWGRSEDNTEIASPPAVVRTREMV